MTNTMNETIQYYDSHAREFISQTLALDVSAIMTRFLQYVPRGGCILDAGCGSGRDALTFHRLGYCVDAFDASETLVALARNATGLPIKQMSFSELEERDRYDAIWACASLLHVSLEELPDALTRLEYALRPGGIAYMSFKHGTGERTRNGRHFTDFDEPSFREFISRVSNLKIFEVWVSADVRAGRETEFWLNSILSHPMDI